ncbi:MULTISPECIES: hypothetical protein [Lysinibacillus]
MRVPKTLHKQLVQEVEDEMYH